MDLGVGTVQLVPPNPFPQLVRCRVGLGTSCPQITSSLCGVSELAGEEDDQSSSAWSPSKNQMNNGTKSGPLYFSPAQKALPIPFFCFDFERFLTLASEETLCPRSICVLSITMYPK